MFALKRSDSGAHVPYKDGKKLVAWLGKQAEHAPYRWLFEHQQFSFGGGGGGERDLTLTPKP